MTVPRRTSAALLLSFTTLVSACAFGGGDDDHGDHQEPIGTTSAALSATSSVSTAVAQSCSTTSVKGLATQLVEEIQCLHPGMFARIDGAPGLSLGAAVFPFLQTSAATALVSAQQARGATMTINSGLRTLPQQYLLYRWYQTGRCGIPLAAAPGRSNHESALAVDINDNAAWRTSMTGKGFRWLGSGDPVHFDYVGAGTKNIDGLSVLAFQRLWNRNHPSDKIDEDGDYGPATEQRLASAPVGGFASGAFCKQASPGSGPGAAPAGADLGTIPPVADVMPLGPDRDQGEAGDEAPTTQSAPLPVDEAAPGGAAESGGGCALAASRPGPSSRVTLALVTGAAVLASLRRRRARGDRR